MNIFFSITALFAYFVAPQIYNSVFIQFITLGFLIQAIYFIFKKSNGNYVNFYSIFYFSYFFVNFFYALILYPIDPDFFPNRSKLEMYKAQHIKFTQNLGLARVLKLTRDAKLVHHVRGSPPVLFDNLMYIRSKL